MMNHKLLMAAMMAATMAEIFPSPRTRRGTGATPTRDIPTNWEMQRWDRKRGDDAASITAAQIKRDRKNAKRAKEIMRPNALGEGRERGILREASRERSERGRAKG